MCCFAVSINVFKIESVIYLFSLYDIHANSCHYGWLNCNISVIQSSFIDDFTIASVPVVWLCMCTLQ